MASTEIAAYIKNEEQKKEKNILRWDLNER
jgi:hypothetical protein